MKKLLILSGKGGTGKTTIASSFIELGNINVYGDCDVDAPNLALVTEQDSDLKSKDYFGMDKAGIDINKCIDCGLCMDNCRFDAIKKVDGVYKVDKFSCEGCGVCENICGVGAIDMVDNIAGRLELYEGEKIFSTASLKMGEGNSGLLVTEVKRELEDRNTDVVIIDGSPGIGCPVIASISGVDMVLVVAEPSVSGISDLKRIVKVARSFDVEVIVTINKYNTNIEKTREIEGYCRDESISLVGKIPFDREIINSVNKARTIVGVDCPASKKIGDIFLKTMDLLKTRRTNYENCSCK